MKKSITILLILGVLGIVTWFVIQRMQPSGIEGRYVVTVGPELVDCVGEGPMKCMVVDDQLFYDQIIGFDYEEGYTYTLHITKEDMTSPHNALPTGTTNYSYTLIEEIAKEPFV